MCQDSARRPSKRRRPEYFSGVGTLTAWRGVTLPSASPITTYPNSVFTSVIHKLKAYQSLNRPKSQLTHLFFKCMPRDRYDLLFECNTLFVGKRSAIWQEMTNTEGQPFPVNHCPLPPDEMVEAASTGIFAVSPPGTGNPPPPTRPPHKQFLAEDACLISMYLIVCLCASDTYVYL